MALIFAAWIRIRYEELNPVAEDLQSISICGHVFHELCLQQWFEYSAKSKKLTCPRALLKTKDCVQMKTALVKLRENNLSSQLKHQPRPLIMWNPRLVSEDVGVGFNVRKLRRYFLSSFTVVYSMKPLPSGAVFRCYPGLWKVFYDEKDKPDRYKLAKEQIRRPDSEELEIIFGNVEENSESGPSFFGAATGIFSSFGRFLRVISK